MRIPDGRHGDDLAVDQLDAIVLVDYTQLAELVVHLDGEGAWEEAQRMHHPRTSAAASVTLGKASRASFSSRDTVWCSAYAPCAGRRQTKI
jgi:hypothetical protein